MAYANYSWESLDETINTSNNDATGWVNKVGGTFPAKTGKAYLVTWSFELQNASNATADAVVRLDCAGDVLQSNSEMRAITEYQSLGGCWVIDPLGADADQTVNLDFRAETNGNSIRMRNARLSVVELPTDALYVKRVDATSTTSSGMVAVTGITLTLAAATTYALLATMQVKNFATTAPVYYQIQGGPISIIAEAGSIANDVTNWTEASAFGVRASSGGNVSLQFRSHTAGSTAEMRNICFVAIPVDAYDDYHNAQLGADSASTSASVVTALTTSPTLSENPHLVLAVWHTYSATNSVLVTTELASGGAARSTSYRRAYTAGNGRLSPNISFGIETPGAGARTYALRRNLDASGASNGIKSQATILLLDLGPAEAGPARTPRCYAIFLD